MIKNPKILILDDSTSAVDTATEAKIRDSFYNELKDTTVFIIAQRVSSVKDADKIIVLDDGEIKVSIPTRICLNQMKSIRRSIRHSRKG